MEQNSKILSLIGLSMKAGKVASGEFATEKAVKSHMAYLVVVSREASENTRKKFVNMCTHYRVPWFIYGGKLELGRAIGKEFRASLAVTDKNLALALEKLLRMQEEPLA